MLRYFRRYKKARLIRRLSKAITENPWETEKVDQVVENILLLTVETPDLIMDLSEVMMEGLTKLRGRQEVGQCSI